MASTLLPAPFHWVAQCFVSASLAILFIQSGVDKVVDRAGNMEWLKAHFSKTIFASMVSLLLTTLTVLELLSGLVCAVGFVVRLFGGSPLIAAYGASLCAVTFVALFTGQRIAKDYAGAGVLVPYMTFTVVSLVVLTMNLRPLDMKMD